MLAGQAGIILKWGTGYFKLNTGHSIPVVPVYRQAGACSPRYIFRAVV